MVEKMNREEIQSLHNKIREYFFEKTQGSDIVINWAYADELLSKIKELQDKIEWYDNKLYNTIDRNQCLYERIKRYEEVIESRKICDYCNHEIRKMLQEEE